jgi:serine/threonine protein kinase/WD40 repeat protein
MNSERWQKIHQLLQESLAMASRERPAFLSQACGSDEHLRLEVESLIASHNQAENFLEAPLSQVAAELLFKDQPALLDGQTMGCYEVLGLLGAGAMGEVYLAQDTRLGRKIALKLLPSYLMKDEGRLRRFEQEARSASALNHPNILTIHEIGQFDDHKFIATEFIQGVTLRQRLRGERIPLISALEICIQVAGALAAAHAAGIVHRDIKPENLMIRDDGYVKVLDFGLAKLTEKPEANADVEAAAQALVKTNPGLVIGTIMYMSPEQARGLPVDVRSDIFSLGVVLYEMIACRAPFDGETVSDLLAAILKEEPAPLKEYSLEVPFELEWIMKKVLAKDREERYQTIRELQIDLKRLKQDLELKAKLDGHNPAERKGVEHSATPSASQTPSADQLIVANKRYRSRIIEIIAMAIVPVAILSLISFYAGIKRAPSPSQPRFRQLTFRRGAVFGARFSPDGNTLIYSAAYDGQPVELFTTHLESPESSSLKLQGKIESISSTGEMAVLLNCEIDMFGCHNGTLARVPLVGGSPRQVMDHVYAADWGPNGQDLAVVRVNEEEGKYQLEYPVGTVLYKAPGRIDAIRVSPNGELVAFIDNPILGDPTGSVIVINRSGQKTTLSGGWKSAAGLAWSSSGNEVWFSGGKDQVSAIYAVKLDGQLRLVFQAPGNVGIKDISRNGRILLQRGIPVSRMFVSGPLSGKERELGWFNWSVSADISNDGQNLLFSDFGAAVRGVPFAYIRKMDGSADPVKLGEGRALALSPDGAWALVLHEGPDTQLVLLPTGVGQPRPLPRGDITEFEYASWLPDGKEILFTALDSSNHLRSYVQDISGGQAHGITEDGMVALLVSPDGKQILSLAQGRYYLSPIDGSGSTQIRGIAADETPIQWSTDGRALYMQETGPLAVKIYRLDLATGRQELRKELLPDPVGFIDFETRPGGIQITPDGKSYVYTYWTALRDLFLAEDLK